MKRTILCFILALMLPACALAQRIEMEDARLAFEYPDSWLVVSPQLARVYERQLEDGGIDSEALAPPTDRFGYTHLRRRLCRRCRAGYISAPVGYA